jgi:hypothetical protein
MEEGEISERSDCGVGRVKGCVLRYWRGLAAVLTLVVGADGRALFSQWQWTAHPTTSTVS